MAYGNNVYLTGNVTREPEGRYTPSGAFVVEFGLAVNESWIPKGGGDRQERTHYFDVTVWRELAENVVETITKGMRVCIEGKMDFQSWEDTDGNKRNKLKVLAEEVSPSLRWATAVVTKNAPRGGGRGEPAGAERYDEPAQGGSQPRQQQRSQQQAPANNGDPGPQYDYDGMDEPF